MKKVSAEQELAVLAEVPGALRKLAAERDAAVAKCAAYERREKIQKIAHAMIEKGIESGDPSTLADKIEKQASEGSVNLDRLADAISLVGPDMFGKTASISDDHHSGSASDFERFVMS